VCGEWCLVLLVRNPPFEVAKQQTQNYEMSLVVSKSKVMKVWVTVSEKVGASRKNLLHEEYIAI
jgi:hypothetical protein